MKVKLNLIFKTLTIKSFVVLIMIGTMDSAVFSQTRIRFARGKTSATVSGNLSSYASRSYVLGASRGQTMTVRVSSTSGRVWVDIGGNDVGRGTTIICVRPTITSSRFTTNWAVRQNFRFSFRFAEIFLTLRIKPFKNVIEHKNSVTFFALKAYFKTMKKISIALCLFFLTAFSLSVFAQNYSIERYLNIRSAGSPTFSPDAKRIAFLTNITGTNQIWFVDSSGGYPEQITSYDDNISFVEWLPENKGLIFGKAIGGNENTQFFHLSDDGANIKQLTADEKTRHNFGAVSNDGKFIFYTSNKRDKNWFDVYRMEIASGKEEILLQDDSSNSVAAVSDDGSRVVVSRSSVRFSLDNDLYMFDDKTKQTTPSHAARRSDAIRRRSFFARQQDARFRHKRQTRIL